MLLNSFLILTWFGKITVIIETDRKDDNDIAHHGFPSNTLKHSQSHWLNWSVQMVYFVPALLDSFSFHCFSQQEEISFSWTSPSVLKEELFVNAWNWYTTCKYFSAAEIWHSRQRSFCETLKYYYVKKIITCAFFLWRDSLNSLVSRWGHIRITLLLEIVLPHCKCTVDETLPPHTFIPEELTRKMKLMR